MRKSVSLSRSGFTSISKLNNLWATGLFVLAFMFAGNVPLIAQEAGIAAGESFVTRFSGTRTDTGSNGQPVEVIDENGVSGSIIDIRRPGQKPLGQHWRDEPQRVPAFARDVGQVFGIAFDDAKPANIYISATAAFGLHRNDDNSDWMFGMWGAGGGPGTVYKLNAQNNYQPEIFAQITLSGRENTGAALGNIAFDRVSRQLFVSDLETGMIHRLDVETGQENGVFDHGIDGRGNFVDVTTGASLSLPGEPFSPASQAQIFACPTDFSTTPSCWNISSAKRRVWGLGVETGADGSVRLYYASWGDLNAVGADKVNWIWSVGITADGDFDAGDVRREIKLPVLDTANGKVLAAPSDMAFSGQGVLLVAERGGMRHLKGDPESPFTQPNISRVLRYSRDVNGIWQLEGPFGIGNLNSAIGNQPEQYNNAAGGVDWGYGYDGTGNVDLSKPDMFVWATGDSLCSKLGPCFDPQTGAVTDEDRVTGSEGRPSDLLDGNLANSYKIDTDLNINQFGQLDHLQATKNDDSKVGDVEIYKAGTPGYGFIPPPVIVHSNRSSHNKYGSHARSRSHYRKASHNLNKSHLRYGSHHRLESHYRLWSHQRRQSHSRYASHNRSRSHLRYGSHNGKKSHYRLWSHLRKKSHARYSSHDRRKSHIKYGSHNKKRSHVRTGSHNKKRSHLRTGSHNKRVSHNRTGSHDKRRSHLRTGSHNRVISHQRIGSHNKKRSHARTGSHDKRRSHARIGSHNKRVSHERIGSHSKRRSHARTGSHDRKRSHARTGSHNKRVSHERIGSHSKKRSHARTGSHDRKRSHARIGSHNKRVSHERIGSHSKKRSHARTGSHNRKRSHARTGSHNKRVSHERIGSHNKKRSHARTGSHNKKRSHARTGSHNKRVSHERTGSHNKKRSHARTGSHNKHASHARKGSHNKRRSHARTGSHNKTVSRLRHQPKGHNKGSTDPNSERGG